MKLDQSRLLAGEELLLSKKVNFVISVSDYGLSRFVADDLMWIAGLQGKEAIGGKLYLTNYRVIFISHSINRVSGSIEIFLPAITKAYNSSRGLTKSITLDTELADLKFIVWGIPKLLEQINSAASASLSPEDNQLSELLNSVESKPANGLSKNQTLENLNKIFLFARAQADNLSAAKDPLGVLSELLLDEAIKNLEKGGSNFS